MRMSRGYFFASFVTRVPSTKSRCTLTAFFQITSIFCCTRRKLVCPWQCSGCRVGLRRPSIDCVNAMGRCSRAGFVRSTLKMMPTWCASANTFTSIQLRRGSLRHQKIGRGPVQLSIWAWPQSQNGCIPGHCSPCLEPHAPSARMPSIFAREEGGRPLGTPLSASSAVEARGVTPYSSRRAMACSQTLSRAASKTSVVSAGATSHASSSSSASSWPGAQPA
jgi:hypothetical protein